MSNSRARAAAAAALFVFACATAHAQGKNETIRPEVGKPLQAAQDLIKAQKPNDALVEISKADTVANKTPLESYLIDRLRASAAAAAGDAPTAVKSFEAVIASGRLTPAEQLPMLQALAGSYYRAKDYPKAIAWAARALKEGGADREMRLLLIHSYYQNAEYESAAQEALADIEADEKAGNKPDEQRLLILANSYLNLKDETRYAYGLEKLVAYYPKKEYWADLIARTQRKPTFADRLAIDLQRLRFSLGEMQAADYMELAQNALTAGYPGEAKRVVDKGYASGVLGAGADADRHKRMRDLVEKKLAEDRKELASAKVEAAADARKDDGAALLSLGYAYVSDGQYEKGLALMERAFRKGAGEESSVNKKPQDNKLHLGIAYLQAGRKDKAIEMFRQVSGAHGAADMARLWLIHARQT